MSAFSVYAFVIFITDTFRVCAKKIIFRYRFCNSFSIYIIIWSFGSAASHKVHRLAQFLFCAQNWFEICQKQITDSNSKWGKKQQILYQMVYSIVLMHFHAHTEKKFVVHCWNFFGRSHNYVWPWAIIDLSMRCNEKTIFGQNMRSARFRVLSFCLKLFFVCRLVSSLSKRANNLMNYFWFSFCLWIVVIVCWSVFLFRCASFFLSRSIEDGHKFLAGRYVVSTTMMATKCTVHIPLRKKILDKLNLVEWFSIAKSTQKRPRSLIALVFSVCDVAVYLLFLLFDSPFYVHSKTSKKWCNYSAALVTAHSFMNIVFAFANHRRFVASCLFFPRTLFPTQWVLTLTLYFRNDAHFLYLSFQPTIHCQSVCPTNCNSQCASAFSQSMQLNLDSI